MYILLKIMSTVPMCLKDMQDEIKKVIGYAKRKSLWLKDFK